LSHRRGVVAAVHPDDAERVKKTLMVAREGGTDYHIQYAWCGRADRCIGLSRKANASAMGLGW